MEELVTQPQSSFQLEYPNHERPHHSPALKAYVEPPSGARSSQQVNGATQISSVIANADLLFRHSETELSFALICQALKHDSYHPEALKLLAQIQAKRKNWPLAAKAMEAVLKRDYSFENLAHLAELYYKMGSDSKALEKYEEAISILLEPSPSLFDVYKNMGNIHCKMGDFQSAEECYHKAFTLNPRSDVLSVNLGTLEIQKSDFNQALLKFRAALEINPKNDKAWVGLAMTHDKMGDFDLAWANIENAVDIAPENRTAIHILSAWALRDSKYHGAIQALQAYLGTVDKDEEMSLMLIHLLCLTEQFELAHLEIERVLLWNPHHEEILKIMVQIPRTNGA